MSKWMLITADLDNGISTELFESCDKAKEAMRKEFEETDSCDGKLNDMTAWARGKFDVEWKIVELKTRLELPLEDGRKLVAEGPLDPNFPHELAVGLVDKEGIWEQDLVVVRQSYRLDGSKVIYENGAPFDIYVYANKDNEDWTDNFVVDQWEEEE